MAGIVDHNRFAAWTDRLAAALDVTSWPRLDTRNPAIAYGRHRGPPRFDARHSAVLMLLAPGTDGPELVLTKRSPQLKSHSGQISLPGGKIEADETSTQAALREYHEELHPLPGHRALRVLGSLPDIHVFVSNFVMSPVVAAVPEWPVFAPNPDEVAAVYHVGLSRLRHGAHWIDDHLVQRGKLEFSAPAILLDDGARVWGATCLAIQMLQSRCDAAI